MQHAPDRPARRRLRPSLLAALLLAALFAAPAGAQDGTYSLLWNPLEPTVGEADAELWLEVRLLGCTRPQGTVTWRVSVAPAAEPPSAAPDADYGVVEPAEIAIGSGATRQAVLLPVLDDAAVDPGERLVVTLSAARPAALACAEGTLVHDGGGTTSIEVTIEDDEPLPQVSARHVVVVEGNGGAEAVFELTLSPASQSPATVTAATADGTATAGEDYEAFAGVVTFAPGTTTAAVRVPVVGDLVDEPNETFALELGDPVGAELAVEIAEALVEDDDARSETTLESVGSTALSAAPGEIVAVTVQVRSRGGRAIPQVAVEWQLQGAGELLDGATTPTGADGTAIQRLRTGTAPGISSLVATDPSGEREIVFTVHVGQPPGS